MRDHADQDGFRGIVPKRVAVFGMNNQRIGQVADLLDHIEGIELDRVERVETVNRIRMAA